METNEIASALIKSSNEDDPKIKELIYKEYNRFAEAVNKIIKDEQKKGEN